MQQVEEKTPANDYRIATMIDGRNEKMHVYIIHVPIIVNVLASNYLYRELGLQKCMFDLPRNP